MKRALVLLCVLALILTACSTSATPTATPAAPTATQAAAAQTPTTAAPAASPTPAASGAASATAASTATSAPASTASPTQAQAGSPAAVASPGTPAAPSLQSTAEANTSPDAAAALGSQAIDLLLAHYVEPPNPADLYSTAYASVVKNLQALGKAGQATTPNFGGDAKQDAATFKQAYVALMQGTGPDINQTIAAYNAIQAVVAQIDECHTYFMDPQQYKLYQQTNSGQPQTYAGIGVEISLNSRPATITKVFAGSPAQAAGLRPGDKILAVDGKDVSNMPAEQISPLVRGQPGTKVTLTIQRPGESAPRDVSVTRANISVPNFTSQVIDGPNGTKIGYMQLSSFYAGAEKDVQKALNDFKQQNVNGWVLDLRDNGGGLIQTLSRLTGFFLNAGPAGYVVPRDGQKEAIPIDTSYHVTPELPFAVLINGNSGSASEAFAAAIQDNNRGEVVGQTSAGCLAGAQSYSLADGSGIQITVEQFLSPKGRKINQVGVKPDLVVQPDTTGAADPQLDAAVKWVASQVH